MPGADPVGEIAGRWLDRAGTDLEAARTLARSGAQPWVVGFHAQQAIEKALKAVLVREQIRFPRTHDLERLSGLVPGDWHLDLPLDRLARVSEFGAETRYPVEDWNDVPAATTAEVDAAVDLAGRVVTAGRERLSRR